MSKNRGAAMRITGILLFIAAFIWFVNSITWVIGLLIISTLIVYVLYPVLLFLKEKLGLPHGVAVGLVFIGFLLFCILTLSLVIPVIYHELKEIVDSLPLYVSHLQASLEWLSEQLLKLNIENEFKEYLNDLSQSLYYALEYITEATLALISGIMDLFFILFLVFYLLYDFQAIREQAVALFPLARRPLAREVVALIDSSLGNFISGSLIRCAIVGVVTGLTLYFIGMSHVLLLGLLAGIFNFVLYIGPYIAAVPALLLSLSPYTPTPMVVLFVYVVIQVLDGILLAPFLLGRVVKLKPITIIISILVGGTLGGLLGMVVAVPVAGIVKGVIELIKKSPAYQDDQSV